MFHHKLNEEYKLNKYQAIQALKLSFIQLFQELLLKFAVILKINCAILTFIGF